jgi:hypothetical protein
MSYIGDFPEDFATVAVYFTTHQANGAAVAPSSAFEEADVAIYKNGSATQKATTNGLTMTSPFDSVTGLHCLLIDTSVDTGDSGFWAAGASYTVILSPDETVDGIAVLKVLATFSLGMGATALLDLAAGIETNRTMRQALRLMLSALAGKASGLGTTTATFRDTNDGVNRIVATVDADGNRSVVTLDAS